MAKGNFVSLKMLGYEEHRKSSKHNMRKQDEVNDERNKLSLLISSSKNDHWGKMTQNEVLENCKTLNEMRRIVKFLYKRHQINEVSNDWTLGKKNMYYTKEQINNVKSVDLVEFSKSMNLNLKQERNAYRILDYDGGLYVFEKNQSDTSGFYWHKYNVKGNAIDFCKMVFKDNYTDAIKRLLDFNNGTVYSVDSKLENLKNQTVYSVDTKKEFVLPERDKEIKQAFAYLMHSRCIDKDIINMCIKEGTIRQFKEKNHVYVGFIGKDKENNAKYLMLRSTLTGSSFKKEYENSNKSFGFKVFNKESVQSLDSYKDIYIFESPIDLLSYMTLNPNKTLENNVFLSMGGVSSLTLEQFIADYKPKIGTINICFDNDDAGQINANKIKERLSSVYSVDSKNIHILKPVYKDYNEQLKAIIKSRDTQNQTINQSKLSNNQGIKP